MNIAQMEKTFKTQSKIFFSAKGHLVNTVYGEGDGTPLQYSCLENPMNGGAW